MHSPSLSINSSTHMRVVISRVEDYTQAVEQVRGTKHIPKLLGAHGIERVPMRQQIS